MARPREEMTDDTWLPYRLKSLQSFSCFFHQPHQGSASLRLFLPEERGAEVEITQLTSSKAAGNIEWTSALSCVQVHSD